MPKPRRKQARDLRKFRHPDGIAAKGERSTKRYFFPKSKLYHQGKYERIQPLTKPPTNYARSRQPVLPRFYKRGLPTVRTRRHAVAAQKAVTTVGAGFYACAYIYPAREDRNSITVFRIE